MADIIRLHRMVELPVRTLDDIVREHGSEGQHDIIDRLRHRRPSTIDRISEALDSPFAVGVYVGVYVGCLLTVVLAYCWSFGS